MTNRPQRGWRRASCKLGEAQSEAHVFSLLVAQVCVCDHQQRVMDSFHSPRPQPRVSVSVLGSETCLAASTYLVPNLRRSRPFSAVLEGLVAGAKWLCDQVQWRWADLDGMKQGALWIR